MMAKILDRRRLVPNLHLIEVHAPEVARKCRPGQFVILMPDEKGERIPLSIADWDAEKGTVTSVFLVVGTSTHKLSLLKPGDELPVYVGPLGKPSEIANFGTVVLRRRLLRHRGHLSDRPGPEEGREPGDRRPRRQGPISSSTGRTSSGP